METVLYVIFFVSCIVLVIAVLLQPGKTDAGALFTSGISSAALNPRGTQSVLSKLTIGAAAVFMLSALLLSLPALTGSRSVLDTEGVEQPIPTEANANTNTNAANSNSSTAGQADDAKSGDSAETNKAGASKSGDEEESGAKLDNP